MTRRIHAIYQLLRLLGCPRIASLVRAVHLARQMW
jgi:hypothetical protein